jgi:hypothetical protein
VPLRRTTVYGARPKRSRPPCRHSGTTNRHGGSRCSWSRETGGVGWGGARKERRHPRRGLVASNSKLRSDPIRSHGRPLRVRPQQQRTGEWRDPRGPRPPIQSAPSRAVARSRWGPARPEQKARAGPLSRAVRQRAPAGFARTSSRCLAFVYDRCLGTTYWSCFCMTP